MYRGRQSVLIVEFEYGTSEMGVGPVSLRWSFGSFIVTVPGVPALEKQRFHPRLACDVPLGLRCGFNDRGFKS